MNLAKNLERSAFYFPERSAVSEDGKETSYALLNERANRIATALLKIGIASGDHVALCVPDESGTRSGRHLENIEREVVDAAL